MNRLPCIIKRSASRISDNVGQLEVVVVFVLAVHVDDLSQYRGAVGQVVSCLGRSLHGGTDDIRGAHRACQVGGIVVAQSAVDQHTVALSHGGEHAGDGHARAHRLGQHAAVEVVLRIVDDVGRHAGKATRQAVEAHRVSISDREMPEEAHQVLALDDSCRTGQMALMQSQRLGEKR